jgi:rubrerythrin
MVTELHKKLADLETVVSQDEPIVSVYVSPGSAFGAGRAVSAQLHGLLERIEAESATADRGARMAVRDAIDRIRQMQPRIAAAAGKTVALFVGGHPALNEFIILPESAWDVATIGLRPYLRPYRAALGYFHTLATVLADPRQTEISVTYMGEVLDKATITTSPIRKAVIGGWHGLDEHRSRNRTEEIHTRHYREVADRLGRLVQDHGVEAIFAGGREEAIAELLGQMGEPLTRLVAGTFTADLHTTTPASLAQTTEELEEGYEQRLADSLITTTLELARAHGLAAAGLADTVAAANLGAIDQLIVAGTSMEPGWMCRACGWLSLTGPQCPGCGQDAEQLSDLIDALVAKAQSQGAAIKHVRFPSKLDEEKVAARLRFSPTPAGAAIPDEATT